MTISDASTNASIDGDTGRGNCEGNGCSVFIEGDADGILAPRAPILPYLKQVRKSLITL